MDPTATIIIQSILAGIAEIQESSLNSKYARLELEKLDQHVRHVADALQGLETCPPPRFPSIQKEGKAMQIMIAQPSGSQIPSTYHTTKCSSVCERDYRTNIDSLKPNVKTLTVTAEILEAWKLLGMRVCKLCATTITLVNIDVDGDTATFSWGGVEHTLAIGESTR